MDNPNLDDVIEVIRVTKDAQWFMSRFEISIEDMIHRFRDLVEEELDQLPYDLDMDFIPEEYEDR